METFKKELGERIAGQVRETMGLNDGDDVLTSQHEAVLLAVEKRTATALQHVNLVKAGPYAFLQWEADYERKQEEEEAWTAA